MTKKENAQPRNAELSAPKNSANATTAALSLSPGDKPRVDSRLLAQPMGVQHKNTLELLQTHKTAFLELGHLRFQTEVGYRAQGAGKVAFQTEALPGRRTGHAVATNGRGASC